MMRVMPLEPGMEGPFLKFLMNDIVGNFFALLNLKLSRGKTKFWLALDGDEVLGYMLEHDNRVINLRCDSRCAAELLRMSRLSEPELNVEPWNMRIVDSFYEPLNPVGNSRGRVNTLVAMSVDKKSFRPEVKHAAKKLSSGEFDALSDLYVKFYEEMTLGPITKEQISGILDRNTKHGATYGIYDGDGLVSFASGSSVLNGFGHLAPIYTSPEFRMRGYATSACSALVRDLLGNNERTILFVSESNVAALKLYRKIGFTRTGHTFFTFWGRRTKNQL